MKKDYHRAEAEEGNVFSSPEIAKGAISVIAAAVIMENWETLKTLTKFKSHGTEESGPCCCPQLSTLIFKGSQSHIASGKHWEMFFLGEKLMFPKLKSCFMKNSWCKYILNYGLSPNYRILNLYSQLLPFHSLW